MILQFLYDTVLPTLVGLIGGVALVYIGYRVWKFIGDKWAFLILGVAMILGFGWIANDFIQNPPISSPILMEWGVPWAISKIIIGAFFVATSFHIFWKDLRMRFA